MCEHKQSLLLQTHLDKESNPFTQRHMAMHQYTNQLLWACVSTEGVQQEDVNNGWHQRPIRPHTIFITSSESCVTFRPLRTMLKRQVLHVAIGNFGHCIENSLSIMLLSTSMIMATLTHCWSIFLCNGLKETYWKISLQVFITTNQHTNNHIMVEDGNVHSFLFCFTDFKMCSTFG